MVALFGVAAPAAASITLALDLDELIDASEVVVLGTVIERHSHYNAQRQIVTDVTLRVEDVMKGSAARGDDIVVRRLGGEVGDIGMRVEGEPTFTEGERAVVFAERVGPDLRPTGMSQGVLRVRLDDGGQELVHPATQALQLVRRGSGGRLEPAPGYLLGARPLADVMDEIRQAVERQSAR